MSTIAEVITPERYQKGFTYPEYVAQTGQYLEQFRENEKAFQLAPEDIQFFRKMAKSLRSLKVLALVEDWSPDVYRALPIMNQIAEAAGMEMRIFRRDQNLDIMDLYLNQGKFRSIPTFAFFDKDLHPLDHWIERPAVATKLIEGWRAELAPKNLSQEEMRAEIRRRREPYIDGWRKETARELKEMLSQIIRKS